MHAGILRRCGLVLIAVGLVDVAYMVWCIANQVSYASSFNVFAVVAGVYLVRGSLRAASRVAFFASLFLAGIGVASLALPFAFPVGYWMALLRHRPALVALLPVTGAILFLLAWIRRQLLHPDVRAAQVAAGVSPPWVRLALALGAVIPLLGVVVTSLASRGDTAVEALRRAEQQLGGQYRYVVTGMTVTGVGQGRSVRASVAAYDDRELRVVEVEWEE